MSLIDPATGFNVYKPEDIKRVSIDYCVDLLTSNKPKPGYEHVFEYNKRIHDERMKEYVDNDIDELPLDTFNSIVEKMKSKPGHKYDFLVKGGEGLKRTLLDLFYIIWREEKLPEGWTDSTVIQLFKQRGSLNQLKNFRHIHDKMDIFKLFNQMVTSFAKEKIVENMSKFQIACIPKH